MGSSGGGLERGGGEKTGSFSTYSGYTSSVILVCIGLSHFPPISPHMSPASTGRLQQGALASLVSACAEPGVRIQKEAHKYVQYLKAINQI